MPYTQVALYWIANALTFALVAYVARRASSSVRGILAAVVIGSAVGYLLTTAIYYAAMFYPIGYFDPLIAAKLKQLGFVK